MGAVCDVGWVDEARERLLRNDDVDGRDEGMRDAPKIKAGSGRPALIVCSPCSRLEGRKRVCASAEAITGDE